MPPTPEYAVLDVRLFCLPTGVYHVELRFTDPESANETERKPVLGTAAFDFEKLLQLQLEPEAYGRELALQVFSDEDVRGELAEVLAVVEARELFLRLRLLVDPSAPRLQGLRWELLRDPRDGRLLTTSERILFFRFLDDPGWRPAKVRRRDDLRALVAVSAPADLGEHGLADVDAEGEIGRARTALGNVPAAVLGDGTDPVTLKNLKAGLAADVDVLYLVCHGELEDGRPFLYLQDEAGKTARIRGGDLAESLSELAEPPRLVVLASCESGGEAGGETRGALAARLAAAGVPAVVAMQGRVTMETVARALPVFFEELVRDGRVDRALSVARGQVRERPDAWMPALYLRLRQGRIWYEAGFGEGAGDAVKWDALASSVHTGHFTPIVGWGLAERIYGSFHGIAQKLAGDHNPLAPHERRSLPSVFQYLQVDQSSRYYALEAARDQIRQQVLARFRDSLEPETAEAELPRLLAAASEISRRDEEDPYRILADLPARVYVNAGTDNLLVEALEAVGREPVVSYPGWKPELAPRPYDEEPTVERPLVYHIFGHVDDEDSLVLAEDDYFDFLIGFSENRAMVPGVVRNALAGGSLLFLGFELTDWSFRVLYRLVLHQAGGHRRRRYAHAAVQVDPEGGAFQSVAQARKYLKAYYGSSDISIFWGSSEEFLVELARHLAQAGAGREEDEF